MKANLLPTTWLIVLFVLLFSCKSESGSPNDYDSTPLIAWNQKVMEMAMSEDGLLTLKGVRTEAMMHIAINDALNSIESVYTFYAFAESSPEANPLAAVAQAAYEVAANQFPDNTEELKNELNRWLDLIDDGKSKAEGIRIGKASAMEILRMRSEDDFAGEASYEWHPMAPGVYAEFNEHSGTPEGFIFGAGWAKAKPFMLKSQDQFRSPPPPDITSDEYTNAFNEVKAYGKFESDVRSEDQTHLAMWWKDFVENSHNRLARKLVIKENLNLWESARLFALLNMTIYDAYVNVFDNKFYYNHWRPYTAIRWAAHDQNSDTEPDTAWNNLHKHTYAFPSYPSAHGTASTAAMTVLATTLGTGNKYAFTMTTEEVDKAGPFSGKIKMDPPTRSFDSFSAAGLEASMSRVYLGIHFRYDSEEGHQLGAKIGEYSSREFIRPVQ
ncbi:vanadium-dependent haloperoxidase [Ekhidna sp. MALMAid0563]|uniref:vanadium-dependent haloperoxidase n=1 Tax=Ekhidna sp. MALMAid0563 TaxID=3143937 RepID=UPI0032DF3B8D